MRTQRGCTFVSFILFAFLMTLALEHELRAEESLQKRVDRLVQPYMDHDVVVGMTVGILQHGQQSVFGYGRMNRDAERVPDGDTVYEIGSISKVYTGVLLADAVERGLAKLDEPAGDLLPPGVTMPRYEGARAITLQDLSTHVSGLPRMPDNFEFTNPANPYIDYSVDQMYKFLSGHKLRRAPGEKWEYSNIGQGVLGHLLALRENKSYEELLHDRITGPLQMTDTSIALGDSQRERLASPYHGDGRPGSNWDIPTLAGAGAIRSTVNDQFKFAAANLHPPAGELGKAIELAWQVHQKPLEVGQQSMGLGWQIAHDGSTRWHSGMTGGYHCWLLVSRQFESAVVIFTNTATYQVDPLGEDIMRMVAGVEVEPRVIKDAVDVAPEIMQRYAGKYELAPDVYFTVLVEDGRLMVGLTDQPTLQVFARSDTEWFYKVVPATITFDVDEAGKCTALEISQSGLQQKAKRVEE